jgi:hypothetical protein
MTERDAFGNPIEDAQPTSQPLTGGDPPSGDGPPTGGDPLTSSDAMGAPVPTPAPAPAPASVSPRRRRRLLGLGGLIGLLLFLAPFLIGGWVVYRAFDSAITPTVDVIDDVREAVREQAKSATDTTRSPKSGPPRGLQRGSLLRPAAVDTLLRKVRADPGGKLLLLRLAPDRADLQLGRRGGGLRIVQLRSDGGRTLLAASSSGGSGRKSITFSKIDTGAPSRLVRAAARRLGRKTTSIDYLVLIDILDGPRWSAYFKGGAAFQGDAHGKIVRRIQ